MSFSLKRLVNRTLKAGSRLVTASWGYLTLMQTGLQTNGRVNVERYVRLSVTDGGSACLQDGVSIDRFANLVIKHGHLEIGARSYIGLGCVICAREEVRIGRDCLLAEHVSLRDQDHLFGPDLVTAQSGFTTTPVSIGDNVWIGANTTVTKGVTIGDNAVIGANTVVTRDIPANTVAVGVPARVIRHLGDGV